MKGYTALLGPTGNQVPGRWLPLLGRRRWFVQAVRAAWTSLTAIVVSGYARAAKASSAALDGPSMAMP